jgi:predicted N-acetyltransferase YhbS
MIRGRTLARDEIQRIWTIDRSEVIEAVYELAGGALVLRPARFDLRGWPPGEADRYTPILQACHDRAGWLYGLFDHTPLIGAAALESRFIGSSRDQLQLTFLHVGAAHRHQGWGRHLFAMAADEARRRGARSLYISATPSQHTIDFYLQLGCRLSREPDPELLALEPEDIHLEYALVSAPA